MLDIINTALGVALGGLIIMVVVAAMALNKKFFRWYMKKAMKVSTEVTEELFAEGEGLR